MIYIIFQLLNLSFLEPNEPKCTTTISANASESTAARGMKILETVKSFQMELMIFLLFHR